MCTVDRQERFDFCEVFHNYLLFHTVDRQERFDFCEVFHNYLLFHNTPAYLTHGSKSPVLHLALVAHRLR